MVSPSNKRIAITGIGPLSAIGIGKDDLWNGIVNKKSGVEFENQHLPSGDVDSFHTYKINNFNINGFGLNNDVLNEINVWKNGVDSIDLFYFLATIKLAIDDSCLRVGDGDDIGIVLAHEHPGLESFYADFFDSSFSLMKDRPDLTKKEYVELLYSSFSKSAYDLQTFMFLYHTAKVFGIHGFSLLLNNACSSGLFAIEAATQAIKSGKADVMIVSAVDNPGVFINSWLKNVGLYAEDGLIKPFAKNRNGFICGQGGAALVLEELEHAINRNAHIYAEYLGGGFSLESWKVTLPDVGGSYYKDSIIRSLEESKINAKNIDLINAHGVATNIMDQYEAEAIRAIFGEGENQPFVNAFKPYVGHNLGGCALLETAMLLLVMEHNIIPPVLNYEQDDPKIKLNIARDKVAYDVNTALKICSSFAGFDAAAVFRKIT